MKYEDAMRKVQMLRTVPAIYNHRRLLEQPIPVTPSTDRAEARIKSGPIRARQRVKELRRSMLYPRSAHLDKIETNNAIPPCSIQQIVQNQLENTSVATSIETTTTSNQSDHVPPTR